MFSAWVEIAMQTSRWPSAVVVTAQGQIASELWFCAGIPILHSQLYGGPPTPLLSRGVLWQKLDMRNLGVLGRMGT